MRIASFVTIVLVVTSFFLQGCEKLTTTFSETAGATDSAEAHETAGAHEEEGHHAKHKLVVTSPLEEDVTLTQQYVCQIHSCRHIDVRALEGGYLEEIKVKEGQTVRDGELIFKILPTLYQAKLDADTAEAQLAQVEYDNTKKLVDQKIVSEQELKIVQAKLSKAAAQVKMAKAEVDFANIKAPFSGIIDRLHEQQGSLIEEGDILTTLSDNSVMWVYFNVPEVRYLEYQADLNTALKQDQPDEEGGMQIELMLANHEKFPYTGKIGAIEADFNNENGNIPFRADFPNPEALLRHGQTGKVLINKVVNNAIVIPQRATYEILAKKYVFVVGEDHVVRQREIVIMNEKDDIFLIEKGLDVNDKIILEGILQVRDGDEIEYEYRAPKDVLANLKYHAE